MTVFEVQDLIQLATRTVMTIRFNSERVTVISLHDENKDFYRGKKDFGRYDIDSVDFHSGCNF